MIVVPVGRNHRLDCFCRIDTNRLQIRKCDWPSICRRPVKTRVDYDPMAGAEMDNDALAIIRSKDTNLYLVTRRRPYRARFRQRECRGLRPPYPLS